jgi:hypothetical protein
MTPGKLAALGVVILSAWLVADHWQYRRFCASMDKAINP